MAGPSSMDGEGGGLATIGAMAVLIKSVKNVKKKLLCAEKS